MDCCQDEIAPPMWKEIDTVLMRHRGVPGSLITALREVQDIVGWFPGQLVAYTAKGLNLPASEVFGVVSFYAFFSLKPRGRHSIKICTGTACYVKGAREIMSRIADTFDLAEGQTTEDRRFDLQGVRCVGACGLAPAMLVGEDVHGDVAADSVLNILEKYS